MGKLVNKIKKGSIILTVWKNEARVNGEILELPNITINRLYMGKNKAWKYGHQFRPDDLKHIYEAIEEYIDNNESE